MCFSSVLPPVPAYGSVEQHSVFQFTERHLHHHINTFKIFIFPFRQRECRFERLIETYLGSDIFKIIKMLLIGLYLGYMDGYFDVSPDYFIAID